MKRLLLPALLVLAGCATPSQEETRLTVDSLRAHREQQLERHANARLVVTVRDSRVQRFRELVRGEHDPAALSDLRRQFLDDGRQLGAHAGLRLVDDYPIQTLGLYVYVYESDDPADLDDAVRVLERQPQVHSVQRVNLFHTRAAAPGPESRPSSSGAGAEDPLAPLQAIPAIMLDRMHEFATGRNVTIAIIDTGIDAAHEDFAGADLTVMNMVEDTATVPVETHATAVTGLILAQPFNGAGIRGIAPDAQLIVLRACWQEYATGAAYCNTFTLAKALAAALEAGVDVVNLSLTGPMDPLLAELVEQLVANNVIVVAAYQDRRGQGPFPASLPGVVAVTARPVLAQDPGPVFAPGEDVITLLPDDRYGLQDGSSISAAQVSGIACLFRQHRSALSGAELSALLHGRGVEQEGLQGLIEALRIAAQAGLPRVTVN